MKKQDCQYSPCHKILEDCTFCYCLIYPCEINKTGGKWKLKKDNIYVWDCSNCNFVHSDKFIEALKKEFKKIITKTSRGK